MPTAPLLVVPFSEVQHYQPDDCLHYESIGVRGQAHHWTIPAHRHEGLHQFQLLTQGAVQGTLDGVPHALQAPVALMVAPGTVHGFVYAPHSVGCQVTVPSSALRPLAQHAPAMAQRLQQTLVLGGTPLPQDLSAGESLFALLGQEFQQTSVGRAEALHSWVQLLALWFLRQHTAAHETSPRQTPRDALLQRYLALVEQHFRSAQALGFYAEALNVTADHLSRVCRNLAGQSALELLHQRQVLEARRLLAYTQAPVNTIAEQLGFQDTAYFSRFFKAAQGCAPSAYRRGVVEGLMAVPGGPSQAMGQPAQATPGRLHAS
ncbi:helix-turn-helix domain-containing protein [Variovorax sp. HJSM1_2]|uniref:helix-turn-helix domain-containing protein n=1 Tax=Variovorax sp. HJSM1_2 TaxID=3366263 RepID=UPI003BE751E1